MGAQSYSRWFTEWPSTHAWVGQTVEVMPVSDHEAELVRLRAVEKAARKACEAEFTSERLAAMDRLRSALFGSES